MATRNRVLVQRSERKPLYVQVLTRPAITSCWSVNLSDTGIGLIATPSAPGEGPKEGEEVELEFQLPGVRARIRARGVVRWRHDSAQAQPHEGGATAALGVQFVRFTGDDQVKVARYLLGPRLKVVVAYATRGAELTLRAALTDTVELLFVGAEGEVQQVLTRGDVSALIVFGTAEGKALRALEQVAETLGLDPSGNGRPREVAPALLYWAPAKGAALIEHFNTGVLYRALPVDVGHAELRASVLDACRSHEIRMEQRRMALELERHLLRDRARTEAPELPSGDAPTVQSAPMHRVMNLVATVAPYRVAVLLQGETGTGKEVLARTVHRSSARAEAAFVAMDCGALPETLLESELFGHVKGSFTGAVADHPGLFVLADGGTIFLDEIENTTANLQAKLLRVIETGEVRPVGGSEVRQVDVRIVAASNKRLEDEVRAGRFRSDLYFRLNTFVIEVPPLRDRAEDVPALAERFLRTFNASLEKSATGFTEEATRLLLQFDWPGNVRELRNVVERAVLLSKPNAPIGPAELPDALVARALGGRPATEASGFEARMAQAEREILRDALERSKGVLRAAARELRMDPVTLGRRAKKLGLWPLKPGSSARA